MRQRFLVLGDHHGDTESLERVLADTDGERFDYVVHVGDFTNAVRTDRETAAAQLRAVEPRLADLAERARHGLVWVWGNRDYFGDLPADLDVGVEAPSEGCVTVGGQRFTNDLDAVASDVILVTHVERWRLVDHFAGRAHFCGNTHLGRWKDRRVNSAFLQYTHRETGDQSFGGYVVVELADDPAAGVLAAEPRSIGSLERLTCERHRERGVQFRPVDADCTYCTYDRVLERELAASAFYGLTHDSDRETVAPAELVTYAVSLWDDPPATFADDVRAYVADLDSDRYAPLAPTEDGRIRVADESYAY